MGLWDYCAICGNRIETGEPCVGVDNEGEHPRGVSICLRCAKIENMPGGKEPVSITDLLDRAEAAEARAEKAKKERDECKARYCAKEPCTTCIHYEVNDCEGDCLSCAADCPCNKCEDYSMWSWNGRTEE